MRKGGLVLVMVALLLGWVGLNQAQDTRMAACALNCLIPTTLGLQRMPVTRQVLVKCCIASLLWTP